MTTQFKLLPISQLQRGEYQPRRHFDTVALEELAQSIRTQGLIEPLIVREIASNRYEIIAGERRWRAAMLAGLKEIPCLIGDYNDEQTAAVALIENIQREDLNLLEEAEGYQRLQHLFHFTQEDIASLMGKSRSHIANLLRLLTLSATVQDKIRVQQLSLGHARLLVGLSQAHQENLAQQVAQAGWSVRRLEEAVRRLKFSSAILPTPNLENHDLASLQNQLTEQMGTPVEIIQETQQSGWIKIKFFDNDTLAGLLERMGLSYDN